MYMKAAPRLGRLLLEKAEAWSSFAHLSRCVPITALAPAPAKSHGPPWGP